jgi:hypothetical protein
MPFSARKFHAIIEPPAQPLFIPVRRFSTTESARLSCATFRINALLFNFTDIADCHILSEGHLITEVILEDNPQV